MYTYYDSGIKNQKLTIREKINNLSFSYIFLICLVAFIGTGMLYSAANGEWRPWALNHLIRFFVSFGLMLFIALVDVRYFLRYAYVFFFITFVLLIIVDVAGYTGMGAQRWIDLKFIKVQPSELMKIALILALAKYFHNSSLQSIESLQGIMMPIAMTILPVILILLQPDLGTSIMILVSAGVIFFIVGVQLWKFAIVFLGVLASLPIAWKFLHEYQQERVLTFLNPERDPLGAGYHIIQSKIALGSGGIFGKGFLQGTQSHLNFLPEKHTDFIFTMLSEEFGMIGAVTVIILNIIILAYGYSFAFKTTGYFGKLVIIGLNTNYFVYVAMNTAMVLDLIPVVGIPLPLISYGGTVMLSVMASFGIIMSVYINRHVNIGKD
ncbi:MAG: rod shape-determining protein RodA [Alphaproteobacteria bacterium]|nr:rod shape-determining protein RodA [Alphaproteobacteria bacterium]